MIWQTGQLTPQNFYAEYLKEAFKYHSISIKYSVKFCLSETQIDMHSSNAYYTSLPSWVRDDSWNLLVYTCTLHNPHHNHLNSQVSHSHLDIYISLYFFFINISSQVRQSLNKHHITCESCDIFFQLNLYTFPFLHLQIW